MSPNDPIGAARLPPGKTLETFEFDAVMVGKAQVMALVADDSWLEKGANLILFGPPGGGKSHLAAAIGGGVLIPHHNGSQATVPTPKGLRRFAMTDAAKAAP